MLCQAHVQFGKDGRGAQKIFFIVQKGAQKKREGAHNNAASEKEKRA